MVDWSYLFLALALAWVLQTIFATFQVGSYRKRMAELIRRGKDGYLGTGTSAGWFSAGIVMLIVTDASGIVTRAERMKGRTVFARLRALPELVGEDIRELARIESDLRFDQNTCKSIRIAAGGIVEQMEGAHESQEIGELSDETVAGDGCPESERR